MAKAATKTSSAAAKKTAPASSKAKKSTSDPIKKISEETLKTLQGLGIEKQLQADLQWCLGSYEHDNNPVGVLEMLDKSTVVLKEEKTKKTKGVTSKLISDLEKILKG